MKTIKYLKKLQAFVLAVVFIIGAAFAVPVYAKTVRASKVDEIIFEKKDGKKYGADEDGNPVSGWTKDKTYYFYENGEAATGIVVLKEKFYCFNSGGKYNAAKTKKIRQAAKYEKPFAPLKKLIGNPKKSEYYSGSCYGKGKDGVLAYDGYTVYTFKPDSGAEIFIGVE